MILEKLNLILEFSLIITSFYLLIFTKYNYLLVVPIIFMFIFFKLLHNYDKKSNLRLPVYYYTLGIIAVYSDILGEFFFSFYYSFIYYDKLLHFFIPIYLAILVKWFIPKKTHFLKLIVILVILGIGAVWELFEYTADSLMQTPTMQGVFIFGKILGGSLEDTMQDMFFNLIGAIIGTFFVKVSHSNH